MTITPKKMITEGETVEVKETTGKRGDACETLCAFLNYDPPICDSNPRNPRIAHVLYLCKELAEYIAPYIDERLFLSRYMLQLPSKETLIGFLKKENEGLPASAGKSVSKSRGESVAMAASGES